MRPYMITPKWIFSSSVLNFMRVSRSRRLKSTSSADSVCLIHPDKIFTNVPPLPRSWPNPILIPQLSNPKLISLNWREFEGSHLGLKSLETALRSVHKRKVAWPVDESALSDLSPGEYLKTLLQPTADLFNQLRSLDAITEPVKCIRIDLDEYIYGVTFSVIGPLRWNQKPPIVLVLHVEDIVDTDGKVCPRVEYALSKALEYNPSATSIIVTNFSQIVVFSPPAWDCPDSIYQRILTDKPSLALRVLSTAYLYNVSPHYSLINGPPPVIEIDPTLILPHGPPNDPSERLLFDEEIFATCYCHSDFDRATLVRDHDRALQFFRWKEHVQQTYSKIVVHPHDTLMGATNHTGNLIISQKTPIYPYDPSEIPTDTAEHLESIQRESPLESCGTADSFKNSKSFTLEIQNLIAEGSKRGVCSVYRCQLTSIDNEPVSSSPSLCLKLFDDRFQFLEKPDPEDDEMRYKVLHWWFDGIAIAEEYALTEYYAYDKLRPVQGSVVPWFYGMHQFTLPNGMVLYGLLMEFIDGSELTPEVVRNFSVDKQIKMIKSCRHASRVLDVADIAQQDWHPGQMLIYNIPLTDIDYVVLIDFGLTTQTWYADEPNLLMNYHGALHTLSSAYGDDWQFVWKHFGEPDDWDPIHAGRPKSSGELVILSARDMFPYITSA